jgi:hypothetical protein
MTTDETSPTSQVGRSRTVRWLGRTRDVPAERQQTRWYRDWPPELKWKITPIRRHPAFLIGPIFLLIFGSVAAGYLSQTSVRSNGLREAFIWLAWLVLAMWPIWKILDWWAGYFFVADDRIVLVSGIRGRKITAIWLAQVTAIERRRTIGGLLLGYGELFFHSPCPDAALVAFDYAPYPSELFGELCELAFPEPPDTCRFRRWWSVTIRCPADGRPRRDRRRSARREVAEANRNSKFDRGSADVATMASSEDSDPAEGNSPI